MPAQPDADRNFIHGLADFWPAFFSDTHFTESYFQAGQLALGQLYLEMLQEVLGTSLEHAPLFSKEYYRLFLIREDQLRFVEGRSSADDRFVHQPSERVTRADTLMNKVIAPTGYLFGQADYEVKDGGFCFRTNPFNTDLFPSRTVPVTVPTLVTSPIGTDWFVAGVQAGDTLQYVLQSAPPVEAAIRYTRDRRMVLDEPKEVFDTGPQRRSSSLRVLRMPFDGDQHGIEVPGQPVSVNEVVPLAVQLGTTAVLCPTVSADWIGAYLYLEVAGAPEDGGFYRVNSVDLLLSTATLNRPNTFNTTSLATVSVLVKYGSRVSGTSPSATLPHTYITSGSVIPSGRRLLDRTIDGITFPYGEPIIEGVDFRLNYETGVVTFLGPWDLYSQPRFNYKWRLLVAREDYVVQGEWSNVGVYGLGAVVTHEDEYWVSVVSSPTVGIFVLTEWERYSFFRYNTSIDVRELAAWAPDVLIDRDRLYTNFGYLLGHRRPSSEQYRAFLKGVSHLFLLGPSLARMRSALNVAANLPVIRQTGERLTGFYSGYASLGDGTLATLTDNAEIGDNGVLLDHGEGVDGVTNAVLGTFYSPTAGFFPADDVGAMLRVTHEDTTVEYSVTAISSDGLTATLSPSPAASLTEARWSYRHNTANGLFRVESSAVQYLFSEGDVDGAIVISEVQGENWQSGTTYAVGHIVRYEDDSYRCITANSDIFFVPTNWTVLGALPARDIGTFRITGVEGPRSLHLNSPFGFTDARGLRWRLTHSREQVVETDRNRYSLPLGVTVRPEIRKLQDITFRAYDTLTDAIRVVDYISDPAWWHRVTIPQELLELENENAGRRQVTPELILNTFDPVDGAMFDDPGLFFDADDNLETGYERFGPALWLGGPWVQLLFPPDVLGVSISDIGQSLTFTDDLFRGAYPIEALGPGNSVQLGRFPPPTTRGHAPLLPISKVELPTIVFRRSIAFVMMDRFLKYHALRAEIDLVPGLPTNFISDAAGLLGGGKPGYTYLFTDSSTPLRDAVRILERFTPDIGHPWLDDVNAVDNRLMLDGAVFFNEYYRFFNDAVAGFNGVGGATVSFFAVPTLPYVPDRYLYVYGKFTTGTLGGKLLALGRDYTFDPLTGAVTVPNMDAGPYRFDYVVVALRVYDPMPVPWWSGVYPGETPVCFDGAGPTLVRPAGGTVDTEGMLERAIQITIA